MQYAELGETYRSLCIAIVSGFTLWRRGSRLAMNFNKTLTYINYCNIFQ
jgi:hypothetical protein